MPKHSELADLARKGYRPRVVNGKVTTLVEVPKDTVLVAEKSLAQKAKANEAKITEVETKLPKVK